ncbi:hypothetical protein [Neptuniibacter sp. QD37_11]|uniref:hypothetical protein n=1 Tax=Neptuniibacter sp. QD37_11 TaxID=3398209 RepID=UPI0039F5858F
MLLKSDFNDFYDAVLAHGTDKKLVYNRKTTTVEVIGSPLAQLNENFHEWIRKRPSLRCDNRPYGSNTFPGCLLVPTDQGLVIFSGKAYPYITFSYSDASIPVEDRYRHNIVKKVTCFSLEQVEDAISKHGNKYDRARLSDDAKRFGRLPIYTQEGLTAALQPIQEDWANQILMDHQSPIAIVRKKNDWNMTDHYRYKVAIELNPCLSDLQFYKVMDAYTAFQELSMYLSGVLRVNEPATAEIEDKYRVSGHGFNDQSFRARAPTSGRKARKHRKRLKIAS